MAKALIVDLDGLLIDSEPLWRKVEVRLFRELGVPLTEEMCRETMGIRIDEAVQHWYDRYPWHGPTTQEVLRQLIQEMILALRAEGKTMPGVDDLLALIKSQQRKSAIASSSPPEFIEAAVEQFGLRPYFSVLHSASLEEQGKPHPGVFITAAQKMGVPPTQCIVLEDSANGVLAAKAAQMACIAVPDPLVQRRREFCMADLMLTSLEELTAKMLDSL